MKMTDYSKMSDFEINAMVHFGNQPQFKIENGYVSFLNDNGLKTGFGKYYYSYNFPDYCNNPADAWPIIIENGISIVRLDKNWLCAPIDEAIDGITGDNEVCFYASKGVVDNKPLRAAMIVFLMMQEKSNG